MSDLTDFLLARIAEDEGVARQATWPAHDAPDAYKPHPELSRWRYRPDGEVEYDYDDPHPYPDVLYVTCDSEGLSPAVREDVGPHIARHDPARVLAECEAKRRIVELHSAARGYGDYCPEEDGRYLLGHCATILALALPYADHPDYREEWRP